MAFYYKEYTSTKTGATRRRASCENCGTVCVYVAGRVRSGKDAGPMLGFDEDAAGYAAEKAESELNNALYTAVDPVPCPECGWYQKDMLAPARQHALGWMAKWATGLLFVAIYCALTRLVVEGGPHPRIPNWAAPCAEIVGGICVSIGLFLTLQYRFRRFNPNEMELEKRLEIGRSRALTVDQRAAIDHEEFPTNLPDAGRAAGGIPCEHCGELMFFPPSLTGSVEACPHCSEYVDISAT